ncbi:aerotolerance regulator BatA [Spirochaetia bacterium]|nr:aerotolerance regulator BatA [Spirochaetia bacterium]GHU29638.1 aerotolerance regulator BatA [Spirochaetia bacterium]
MTFEHPFVIVAGILIIIIAHIVSRFLTDVATLPIPLGPPGGIAFKSPVRLSVAFGIIRLLEIVGVLFLFATVAGPVYQRTEVVWRNRGADILFILDLSPSMAALDRDYKSRFDHARNLIRNFAESRPADAIGLVAVGNDAALLVAPTHDRISLLSRLESTRLGELGNETALGTGIALAAFHLRESTAPRRAIVLITDGENNAGSVHPSTAAEVLPEIGASFWVIGMGTSGEVPIDYLDPITKIRRAGSFESHFDPENLKQIAARGEGTYLEAPSADSLQEAFSRIDQAEMVATRPGINIISTPFHETFLIIAVLLILIAWFFRRIILGSFL